MEKSNQEIGKQLVQIIEELAFVERFLSTRIAAVTAAVEELRTGLGLSVQRPTEDPVALDLPFRRPISIDAVMPIEQYKDFFAGWQLGWGQPSPKCSVRQLPAPDSALTYPGYRLIASIRREGEVHCEYLSLEFESTGRYFPGARHCDLAIRMRSDPPVTVKPMLRLFLEGGKRLDLWGTAFAVEDHFKSFASVFELPADSDLGAKPVGARVIYFLPPDVELALDVAYVVQGFRHE